MDPPFNERQPDSAAVKSLHLAETLKARTVQYRDALAAADAHNMLGMVRLAASQEQARLLALPGWQVEAMHRNWSKAVLVYSIPGAGKVRGVSAADSTALQHPITASCRCV
jgi:hypothetical protein